MMCPDPQLLSIYIDGEMPSPWKEKLESHLSECSECGRKLAQLRRLQGIFIKDREEKPAAAEASMEKVRNNLEAAFFRHGQVRRFAGRAGANVWRRKVSVPLPLAAAAVLFIIFTAGLWLRLSPSSGSENYAAQPSEHTNFMLAAEEDIPVMQVTDMESLLQYLGSSGGENIIFVLPESRNFSRSGDPAMIRAADYLGRQP